MAYIILTIILVIAAIAVGLLVMLQKSKSYGLSAGLGGGSGETYFSRNKGRTKEGRLRRYTIIAGIVFFVVAILLNVGAITQL